MRCARRTFLAVAEEGACFDGGVVGDDHERTVRHTSDSTDHTRSGGRAPLGIHSPGGPATQFEKPCAGVDQSCDPLASGQPVFLMLTVDRSLAAAGSDLFRLRAKLSQQRVPFSRERWGCHTSNVHGVLQTDRQPVGHASSMMFQCLTTRNVSQFGTRAKSKLAQAITRGVDRSSRAEQLTRPRRQRHATCQINTTGLWWSRRRTLQPLHHSRHELRHSRNHLVIPAQAGMTESRPENERC